MTRFILNDTDITTQVPPATTLLDFVRYQQHLTGTKIGCREGDCGACTVLIGQIKEDELVYETVTSCLMPIGNAEGKHIVTIEGLNVQGLNAVQQAFADEGATQCGFCTPGFIVSLAGFCMRSGPGGYEQAIDSMNGNICRCTGYKSIERAAARVTQLMQKRTGDEVLAYAVKTNIIPAYFLQIKERLNQIRWNGELPATNGVANRFLGGGTDLYVQQHDTIVHEHIEFLFDKAGQHEIRIEGDTCVMGASVTAADLASSKIFAKHFPALDKHIKLVSSTQIRNMATLAGNFCNGSPIGDFTIFFLALDAKLLLSNGSAKRKVALRNFYLGYKKLDKDPDEFVEQIFFTLPAANSFFNFEKVSKRTHLDIASVNTAMYFLMKGDRIESAAISAGGVGPIPTYLVAACDYLKGQVPNERVIDECLRIIQSEISPISDARGTAEYKRLLLQQLVKAHLNRLEGPVT